MSPGEASPADGRAWRILGLVTVGTLVTVGGRLVLAPLLPAIIDDLAISPARAGFALTALTGTAAICRYPGGRLADGLTRKTVLVAAFGFLSLGFAVLAGATGYPLFLLGAVAVGVGAGFYVPTSFALLADLFTARRGWSFGVNNAAFNLGGVAAAGLSIAVLEAAAWRAGFLPLGLLFLVLLGAMHRWNDEPYRIARVSLDLGATAGRIGRSPRVLKMLLAAALAGFVWNGGINFLPTYLRVEKAFAPWLATTVFAGVFVVGAVVTPASGSLGDRIGHLATTTVALGIGVVGLALLVAGRGPVAVVGSLVLAVGLTAFWPVMNAYVMALIPRESRAGDFGALGTVYIGAGSLGPTFVGVVAERVSYAAAYLGLSGCLVASLLVTAWLARSS